MPIIGIDLGTTFSGASTVRNGEPVLLPVGDQRIMPSVVGVSPDEQWLVGQSALNQWVLYPENTVRSIKRKMGSNETVSLGGNVYTPQQISAMILQKLKLSAEEHLGEPITQAVITVPAYFSDAQRQATRDAGTIAGLEVMRIINEPTAAALAYGLQEGRDEVSLVYDLGGGTFDASLVELSGGVVDVRASHGNTQLGGDDFDERLADWLRSEFESKHKVDVRGDRQAMARIRQAAEQAKINLSTEPYTWVREEYLAQKGGVPLHMEIEVSRSQFLTLISDLLDSTLDSVNRVLKDGEIEKPEHILLVGGSTYIPAVWDMLANHLGVAPRQDVNPSEAVALGAGIQGAIVAGEPIDAILVDVAPYSLGIAIADITPYGIIGNRFKRLIPRNSTIPVTRKEVFNPLYPGQDEVKIKVYQGESSVASENILLGEFLFEDLEIDESEGFAAFTVQFDIDVNGVLDVQAVDKGSEKKEGITVKASSQRLSQAELEAARDALPEIALMPDLPEDMVQEATVLLGRADRLLAEAENQSLKDAAGHVRELLSSGEQEDLEEAIEELIDELYEAEEEQEEESE
ncbi:MAG: Hsp70 family protein [Anaerolineae bacterium]|nr:Hsp70 family protein [Anaerolineae bacterium]